MAVLFLFLAKQITFFGGKVLGVTKEIPFIALQTEKQDKIRLNAFLMHNFSKDCTAFQYCTGLKVVVSWRQGKMMYHFIVKSWSCYPSRLGQKMQTCWFLWVRVIWNNTCRHDVLTRSLSEPINTAIASLSSRRNALVKSFCMQNGIFSPKPGLTLEIKDPDPYSTMVAQPFLSHPGLWMQP